MVAGLIAATRASSAPCLIASFAVLSVTTFPAGFNLEVAVETSAEPDFKRSAILSLSAALERTNFSALLSPPPKTAPITAPVTGSLPVPSATNAPDAAAAAAALIAVVAPGKGSAVNSPASSPIVLDIGEPSVICLVLRDSILGVLTLVTTQGSSCATPSRVR